MCRFTSFRRTVTPDSIRGGIQQQCKYKELDSGSRQLLGNCVLRRLKRLLLAPKAPTFGALPPCMAQASLSTGSRSHLLPVGVRYAPPGMTNKSKFL